MSIHLPAVLKLIIVPLFWPISTWDCIKKTASFLMSPNHVIDFYSYCFLRWWPLCTKNENFPASVGAKEPLVESQQMSLCHPVPSCPFIAFHVAFISLFFMLHSVPFTSHSFPFIAFHVAFISLNMSFMLHSVPFPFTIISFHCLSCCIHVP